MGAMGGAEKVLVSVIRGTRQERPEARLHLLSLAAGPLLDHAAHEGADVSVLPLPASLASLGDSQLVGSYRPRMTAFSALGQAARSSRDAWGFVERLQKAI